MDNHNQRGFKGGKARAASLSPERRKEIARQAAKKRWSERTDTVTKEGHAEWSRGSNMVEKLIITVELSSGNFYGRISLPLDKCDDSIDAWLKTTIEHVRKAVLEVTPRSEREVALEAAAQEFVLKVERGEAKSTRSYAAFKKALGWGLEGESS